MGWQMAGAILAVLDQLWALQWCLRSAAFLLFIGRFLHGRLLQDSGDVLHHLATQRHSQRLYTPADAKNRYLSVVCQTSDKQLWQVAVGVDTVQLWQWLLTGP